MKFWPALLALVVAGSAAAQTPGSSGKERWGWQPKMDSLPKSFALNLPAYRLHDRFARRGEDQPKPAPEGKLCLAGIERCQTKADLIRKPYQPGDRELYLLEKNKG